MLILLKEEKEVPQESEAVVLIFPHEFAGLLESLRRDRRHEEDAKLQAMELDEKEMHAANARLLANLLEALNPKHNYPTQLDNLDNIERKRVENDKAKSAWVPCA